MSLVKVEFALLLAKALVVVALECKQLLEVGLAEDRTVGRRVGTGLERAATLLAAEAPFVVALLLYLDLVHHVHGLGAHWACVALESVGDRLK